MLHYNVLSLTSIHNSIVIKRAHAGHWKCSHTAINGVNYA